MNHKAKILWESAGKTPDGNPFSTIKQARGYYTYLSRGGVDSVFFILYDKNLDAFALISESKPPMDERMDTAVHMTTAFGGSIDSKAKRIDIVKTEVLEESGFDIDVKDIHYIGSTLVSSQMDQTAYGYLVDVTNYSKTHIAEYEQPNATEEFNGNNVVWLSAKEVVNNSDWKSIFILVKYFKGLL